MPLDAVAATIIVREGIAVKKEGSWCDGRRRRRVDDRYL